MGHFIHRTLTITCSDHIESNFKVSVEDIQKKASDIFHTVTNVTTGMNGHDTFSIHTTGSKVGWKEEEEDTLNKEKFIEYLDTLVFEDGSGPVGYVYFEYGDTGARILKTNTEDVF